MHWYLIAFFILFICIALSNAIAPQAMWRRTRAWQYKNPSAAEPSAAAFKMQRVAGVVMALIGVVLLIVQLTH